MPSKLWFVCNACGHEFENLVSDMRMKEDPCPECHSDNVVEAPPDDSVQVDVTIPVVKKKPGRPKKAQAASNNNQFDPVVGTVIQKFITRSLQGMQTYGITMADNDAPTLDWINHAQEELMDAILYLERLKANV